MSRETDRIVERYARRGVDDRYGILRPDVWCALQERQRAVLRLLADLGWHDLDQRRAVEVGCGAGGNLLELLRLGFRPEHLVGIELLPGRAAHARSVLPPSVQLLQGDATQASIEPESQDLVLQYTVFSSLLDDDSQARLAEVMWRWVRPGGGVLWYDFTVDNPRNADVRGVPLRRVRELFPRAAGVRARRVTLAPPLARAVTKLHPSLYGWLNVLPWLRTHRLCWLAKAPAGARGGTAR